MTTCLENLEMSGNFTDVREMSGISLSQGNVGIVREKILSWKIAQKLFVIASGTEGLQMTAVGLDCY